MPLGAFISSREIMQSLSHDPELGHITTFGGHPVSCAAAQASLQFLAMSKIYREAEHKAALFLNRLSNHPAIKEIRHKGLMIGLDLESTGKSIKLIHRFIENGLIGDLFLFRPQAFRIAPPLVITEEEIHLACDRIIKSLDEI
jgi:acetylornithine/succinyldiaminopimelate/putrescine aminotransferase